MKNIFFFNAYLSPSSKWILKKWYLVTSGAPVDHPIESPAKKKNIYRPIQTFCYCAIKRDLSPGIQYTMRGVRRSFSVDFHIVEFDELEFPLLSVGFFFFLFSLVKFENNKTQICRFFFSSDDPSTTCYTTSVVCVYKQCSSSCVYCIRYSTRRLLYICGNLF
jgi:hypothetical protein